MNGIILGGTGAYIVPPVDVDPEARAGALAAFEHLIGDVGNAAVSGGGGVLSLAGRR